MRKTSLVFSLTFLLWIAPWILWAEVYQVASVQFNPTMFEKSRNVEELYRLFRKAAKKDAKVIVAPEMATVGYTYKDRDEIMPFVETIPGDTTARFSEISQKYKCYIAWGMAEKDPKTGLFYNSMALVGPEGYLGKYRKTNLWETDTHWAAWGNKAPPVYKTPWGNITMTICQGANYIETFRMAMLDGADIVCFATNSSGQTIGCLQARAIENGLYIISANRSNEERGFTMKGCSAIWSPTGEKLDEAGIDTEEIIYAEIDTTRFGEKEGIKARRKPELYLELMLHIAPWDFQANTEPKNVMAIALQYEPAVGSVRENKLRVEELLKDALAQSYKINIAEAARLQDVSKQLVDKHALVVLPEYSFTGRVPLADVRNYAETLDGKIVSYVSQFATTFGAYFVFALIEMDGKDLYNTAVLIGPDGKTIGTTRKIHLNDYDRLWAKAGKKFRVFDTPYLGKVGLLIGSDAYMPESGAILAVKRADIVAIPSSWHGEVAGDGEIAINPEINPHAKRGGMVLWDNMAWNFLYYTVVANFVGTENRYLGKSGIYSLDPIYGIESPGLARTMKDEAVVGTFRTIHSDHWINQQKYIDSRRPDDLYHPIIFKQK